MFDYQYLEGQGNKVLYIILTLVFLFCGWCLGLAPFLALTPDENNKVKAVWPWSYRTVSREYESRSVSTKGTIPGGWLILTIVFGICAFICILMAFFVPWW